MTPEKDYLREIQVNEALRDLLWSYLPPQARTAKHEVKSTYTNGNGLLIEVVYSPDDAQLSITTTEDLGRAGRAKLVNEPGPPGLLKDCILHPQTGEIYGYLEELGTLDARGRFVSPKSYLRYEGEEVTPEEMLLRGIFGKDKADSEAKMLHAQTEKFTQDKLDYLMGVLVDI